MEKIRIECTEEQLDLIIKAINKVYSERDLKKYFGYKGPIELNATHKYKTENENILNSALFAVVLRRGLRRARSGARARRSRARCRARGGA